MPTCVRQWLKSAAVHAQQISGEGLVVKTRLER